jgi:glycosyltransferase involved in cell wall biosynthesis
VHATPNKSAEDVSQLLSRTKVALLPFPDGVTLRRGTALASMGNGALLVTRASSNQHPDFDRVCVAVPVSVEISDVLPRILERYEEYESIRVAGVEFARSFTWRNIAVSYIDVLKKVSA